MPHKYNADRRHHIPRARYKVTNWKAYEAGLRQRGSLTVWFSEEAVAAWRAAPRTTPGGQARYSDLAVETVPSGLAPTCRQVGDCGRGASPIR